MASNVIPFPRRNSNDDDTPPTGPQSPLLARLLAPLPDHEVQPNSRSFQRELQEDRHRPWLKMQLVAEEAEFRMKAAKKALEYAKTFDLDQVGEKASEHELHFRLYWMILDRMMMTPAPSIKAYRWKCERSHWRSRREWIDVIDADLQRLQRKSA